MRAPLRRSVLLVPLTLALTALTAVIPLPSGPGPVAAAAATWNSGAYVGPRDTTELSQFGTWRNASATHATDFVDHSSWSSISDPSWAARGWAGTSYQVTWSVPMLPEGVGSVADGAAGAYNSYFAAMARALVANSQDDAILRIGWEMNGAWYRWTATNNPTQWISFYRQIVTAIRGVSGQHFRFEWSPILGSGKWGFNTESAYPGDAYVDIIAVSAYDQSWSRTPAQDVERWNDMLTMPYGWNWLGSFASAHGKPISVPEWGLSQRTDGHGGGDNVYFIERMHNWLSTHNISYETYFEFDQSADELHAMRIGNHFPNAAARYRQLWGGTSSSTGSTTSGPTGTRVSWFSDRRDDGALDGIRVNGRVYVFVRTADDATRVRFYLDDTDRSGSPMATETYAPFDLMGGTASAASPLDTSTLSGGTHTMTVVIDRPSGSTVSTATFAK
jgi:hypothetical protein